MPSKVSCLQLFLQREAEKGEHSYNLIVSLFPLVNLCARFFYSSTFLR